MAVVTVMAGSPLVGLVACAALVVPMGLAVVAETVAFYRIGLADPEPAQIGSSRPVAHRPGQTIW